MEGEQRPVPCRADQPALARLARSWAYATARNHESRAAFLSIGSIVAIHMALRVLLAALF